MVFLKRFYKRDSRTLKVKYDYVCFISWNVINCKMCFLECGFGVFLKCGGGFYILWIVLCERYFF